jgi:putative transposase
LSTNEMIDQRLDYIHQNPVRAGIVDTEEDYLYSSARNYADRKDVLMEVDFLF